MKRHALALTLIGLVAALLFAVPLLQREIFTFRDHSEYFQPLRFHTATELQAGRLPLWNPYNASGEAWLANPQTGVFYPPTWIFLILPFDTAYVAYLLLHLLILGCSAYLLFHRSASREASLVGAVTLMCCGPVLSLVDVSNNFTTFAWLPLVIWTALRPVGTTGCLLSAAAMAMSFLAGEPFFAALGAIGWTTIVLIRSRRAGMVTLAALTTIGLTAVQLFPFIETIRGSDRVAGFVDELTFRHSMPLRDWIRIVVPPKLDSSGFDPRLGQHFIPIIYVGLFAVTGAVAALVIMAIRRDVSRRLTVGWLAVFVGAVVFAAGWHLPTGVLISKLPLTVMRYPARVVPIAALALIALAVLAWDRVRPQKRWVDLLVVLVVLLDLVPRMRPLLVSAPFRVDRVPFEARVGRTSKIYRIPPKVQTAGDRDAWISGYLNLLERRFDTATAAPITSARHEQMMEQSFTAARFDLLNLMSGGFVLADRMVPTLQPSARVGRVMLFPNPRALPMATFWGQAFAAPSEQDALRMTLDGSARGRLLMSPSIAPGLASAAADIRVAAVSLDSSSARIEVDAPRSGVVLLTQQSAPGWRVRVDGVEKTPLTANGILRAVEIEAGRHEIVWLYRPRSLYAGGVVTAITILFLIAMSIARRTSRALP